MSKLGIVGYRNYNNYDEFKSYVSAYIAYINTELNKPIISIISGGCKGTDTMAIKYAKENNIPYTEYKPQFEKYYGNKAYLERNTQIVNDSTHLMAFLHPSSKGTHDTINKAKKKGININIVNL